MLSSTTSLPSFQHKLVSVVAVPWVPSYTTCLMSYLEVIPFYIPRLFWEFHHFLRILDTSDTSCHLRSFLGPRVVSNQKTDNWTMMCESKTSSNPIALKLMVDISFLDHWLSNHHSNIDHATWAHISGAPFNQCLVVYVFLQHTSLYHLIRQILSPCSHNCGKPSFEILDELLLSPSANTSSSL